MDGGDLLENSDFEGRKIALQVSKICVTVRKLSKKTNMGTAGSKAKDVVRCQVVAREFDAELEADVEPPGRVGRGSRNAERADLVHKQFIIESFQIRAREPCS